MAFLEVVPPSQELRKEFQAILDLPQGKDAKEGLVSRGKALRKLLSKWEDKVSQSLVRDIKLAIDLTIQPVTASEKPEFPNPKGFDSGNAEQMDEFKRIAEQKFDALDEWHLTKKAYQEKPSKELDPLNRYMELTEKLNRFVGSRLSPRKDMKVYITDTTYTLVDNGLWPGHFISEIKPNAYNKAKAWAALRTFADVAYFRFYMVLPEQVKKIEKEPEPVIEMPKADSDGVTVKEPVKKGTKSKKTTAK